MKKVILYIFFSLTLGQYACTQSQAVSQVGIVNPKFKKTVDSSLSFTVPTTTVDILSTLERPHVILDAREREEYDISHIPDALYFGYKKPEYTVLDNVDKDALIIIYCSIGYRSEKLGQKLKKKGYKNVLNLYGSIFEWANRDFPIHDGKGNPTKSIHGYNKKWSKWVDNDSLEVVW